MDFSNLEKVLEGEPKYRVKQAREAVFKKFISNWNEASFFSKKLREKLNKECPLEIKADVLVAKNKNSVKAKITLKDGSQIETVLMRHKDNRNTVCVSCQVGCPLGCLFCATGKMGFKRNLSVNEILEQVIFFERYLENKRVTNVTFMGMGEPFLNYDNVLESIKILNNKEYFGIGARSISVSTSGIIEGIAKLADTGLPINLAISLHAPNNKLRAELMPISKKYTIENVFKAVDAYIKITKRKVMFEYVLIKNINDSDECAKELANLMQKNKKLYFVNLILYNPISSLKLTIVKYNEMDKANNFRPAETKRVESFKKILKNAGVNFVQRYRFGDDIQAACGQFAASK